MSSKVEPNKLALYHGQGGALGYYLEIDYLAPNTDHGKYCWEAYVYDIDEVLTISNHSELMLNIIYSVFSFP
jgi:hypothetical protein